MNANVDLSDLVLNYIVDIQQGVVTLAKNSYSQIGDDNTYASCGALRHGNLLTCRSKIRRDGHSE